jgi:hypothetical protein
MKKKNKISIDHYTVISDTRRALMLLFDAYNAGTLLSPENYTFVKNAVKQVK